MAVLNNAFDPKKKGIDIIWNGQNIILDDVTSESDMLQFQNMICQMHRQERGKCGCTLKSRLVNVLTSVVQSSLPCKNRTRSKYINDRHMHSGQDDSKKNIQTDR